MTVVGHDRPGIVARVAGNLSRLGMNLEDSSMTLLRGQFAMTLICAGEAERDMVREALSDLSGDGLTVSVLDVTDEQPAGPAEGSVLVTVHGSDRLGIVARLTAVVADAGGNITDLSTRLTGDLYVLTAEVDLAAAGGPDESGPGAPVVNADELANRLQAAATELGVNASVRRLDRDEL